MTFPSAWARLQRAAEILATDLETVDETDEKVALSKELRAILLDLKKHAEPAPPTEEKSSSEVPGVVNLRNRRAQRRADAAGGELPPVRGDVG